MKLFYKTFLVIISIWTFSSCSLPESVLISSELDKKLNNYQRVIEVPDKDKKNLYLDVNEWLVRNFTKSDEVIEFEDKEAGKISGKYVWRTKIQGQNFSSRNRRFDVNIRSTVLVDIKDEKVRVRMENPLYKGINYPEQGYNEIRREETAKRVLDNWEKVTANLKKALLSKDEEW